jgi:hypothetical protein
MEPGPEHPPTIICVASFFKGNEFIRAWGRRRWA